jgi:hypothetical protein
MIGMHPVGRRDDRGVARTPQQLVTRDVRVAAMHRLVR